MLARRGELAHPDIALPIELPLLVPSFTSKGFEPRDVQGRRQYEVAGDLADFANRPAKAILVSAYDLHFRHLDLYREEEKSTHKAESALLSAEIVFLDSGGYELDKEFDSCEPRGGTHVPPDLNFNEEHYVDVINGLQSKSRMPPLCIASFDNGYKGLPLDKQITMSRALFTRFDRHVKSFILKPSGERKLLHTEDISPVDIANLRSFDIVGVTADELGKNLKDRLQRIAGLRKKLNEARITAPIHVWGGLDPLVTPLYFFAGAELFDGVSWLRYGFHDGFAINRRAFQVLCPQLGIQENSIMVRGTMAAENRAALNRLGLAMRAWATSGGKDYDGFDEPAREHLHRAYRAMQGFIEGV